MYGITSKTILHLVISASFLRVEELWNRGNILRRVEARCAEDLEANEPRKRPLWCCLLCSGRRKKKEGPMLGGKTRRIKIVRGTSDCNATETRKRCPTLEHYPSFALKWFTIVKGARHGLNLAREVICEFCSNFGKLSCTVVYKKYATNCSRLFVNTIQWHNV